jgi:signal transduction histidine kinase/ActR/RegA family two-component response regulator
VHLDGDTSALIVRLADPIGRAAMAGRVARSAGAHELVMLVRDPDVQVLLPAPGFPQTLCGGPRWRALLQRCADETGRHAAIVDLPAGTQRDALALAQPSLTAVLIGGMPSPDRVAVFEALMPLLGAAFAAEQRVRVLTAEAVAARGAAEQAQMLAVALDAARAEGARLNERLREEHRRKDDFLAMLAHELRNPLTPLVTSIELLQLGSLDRAAVARQLDVMERQVTQLVRLVEDLLDVSRVSRGRIELRRVPVDLVELASEALDSSRPLLEARQQAVQLDVGVDCAIVDADAVRIRQVLANLLHNAAKYTDPGGRIELRVRRDETHAIVEVADNGLGIARDMLPRVFDLFVQAPVSLERAQGGLGIGLTLVRSIVELHGGSVSVSSPGLGQGSCFSVRLPLGAATPALAQEPPAVPLLQSRALRVLVVDDNQDAANALGLMLELLGHTVHRAYTGLAALQVAGELNPDLVLLDIGLPQIDGYELARRLRRITRRGAWFVAVTGYGTEEDKRRAREAGFDEHRVKPLAYEHLLAITRRLQDGVGVAPIH